MAVAEATFTDFLRHPNEVTEHLEQGDVILHRRGEADLRLSVAARADSQLSTLEFLGRVIAQSLRDDLVRRRITELQSLPWLTFMPEGERSLFWSELFECVEGAAQLGTLAPVARLLDEWRATAEVYADPELAARLRRALPGDGPVVSRPNT